MLTAVADVLRAIGGTLATLVMLPFRAVARLLTGVAGSFRRGPRRHPRRRRV
ncbi:LPFR motif small protein [Streptomyces sp. 4N509B]|uniref:LPFR motif small protein n=1 Tax=Streptomyces sp. 4N509B TaxID=3457413 RepID=UPI003FD00BAB